MDEKDMVQPSKSPMTAKELKKDLQKARENWG